MWEKYDVRFDDGRSRIGDKAAQSQVGFGWSNGVALIYLKVLK
jgi:neutral trehalase